MERIAKNPYELEVKRKFKVIIKKNIHKMNSLLFALNQIIFKESQQKSTKQSTKQRSEAFDDNLESI